MPATHDKTIFALVGLPARGKSFLSTKIVTFFNWSGIPARIFNAGSKRREKEGAAESGRSSFFHNGNSTALCKRDAIAMATLGDAIQWLTEDNGSIAIFDATNTTQARRSLIQRSLDAAGEKVRINLVFIESICNDEEVLRDNFLQKVRNSPDFAGMDEIVALADLQARVKAYESVYETITDEEKVSYIKIIDLASKVICNEIWGAVCMRCVQLLMSCHIGLRPVYLARAGHCDGVDDLSHGKWFTEECIRPEGGAMFGSIGPYVLNPSRGEMRESSSRGYVLNPSVKMPSSLTGDARLSQSGQQFARRFAKYIQLQGHKDEVIPFSSTMPRAIETVLALGLPEDRIQLWSALGILDTGTFHGLSVKYIQDNMPRDYAEWERDPLHYRFPGGESILDMNKRLAEVVLEIEHIQKPVAVVSHLSTIQSLVAYFTGKNPELIPHIHVPRHSVLVLQPNIYGWGLKIIPESELPEA